MMVVVVERSKKIMLGFDCLGEGGHRLNTVELICGGYSDETGG